MRRVDLGAQLARAGFADVVVEDRPEWTSLERDLWSAAVDIDAGDDPALAALRDEALAVLPTIDRRRRVIARAVSPDPGVVPGAYAHKPVGVLTDRVGRAVSGTMSSPGA
jgi:hypothetical protein